MLTTSSAKTNTQPKHFHFKAPKIIQKKHSQSQAPTTTTTQHSSPCQSVFRLATWNCSGIRDKEDRLLRWMSRENVDVCCVTETWLHPDKALPQSCRAISAMFSFTTNSSISESLSRSSILTPNERFSHFLQ